MELRSSGDIELGRTVLVANASEFMKFIAESIIRYSAVRNVKM